jgi:hypothetical protein
MKGPKPPKRPLKMKRYTPLEAAIRWAGAYSNEDKIEAAAMFEHPKDKAPLLVGFYPVMGVSSAKLDDIKRKYSLLVVAIEGGQLRADNGNLDGREPEEREAAK